MGNSLTKNNHNDSKIKHGDSPNSVMNKHYFWKIVDFFDILQTQNNQNCSYISGQYKITINQTHKVFSQKIQD